MPIDHEPSTAIQVLIIEDDIDYVEIIRLCLDEPDSMGLRFELERADRLEVGLKLLKAARFDAVLLDLTLPDSRGIETVKRMFDSGCDLPVLVMTNLGDEKMAFEAMRLGAQDYMIKSTSDSRLIKRAIWYGIERKKLLSQSETIIKRSPDAMFVVDQGGAVRFANPAAQALLGRDVSDLTGKPFPFEAAPGQTTQHTLKGPEGMDRVAEMRVTEIQWKGAPARLASMRDITELQRIEQLKADIRERRRLDRLKDELIGTVSHELRTPLTIVKGAIDNLKEGIVGPLTQKQNEIVGLAHRNIARLAKMINNLLDLSRLESGKARAYRRRVETLAFLREIADDFSIKAAERKLSLSVDAPEDLPPIFADPELINEVFVNLLDNAIRFAKTRVTLRACSEPGERGVRFEVDDDGPGIPQEKINDLFNKFVQINRQFGGSGYKGTGLGLAISKEIMALHDAKIQIESVPGLGTRFCFVLPEFKAPAAERPTAERAERRTGT